MEKEKRKEKRRLKGLDHSFALSTDSWANICFLGSGAGAVCVTSFGLCSAASFPRRNSARLPSVTSLMAVSASSVKNA